MQLQSSSEWKRPKGLPSTSCMQTRRKEVRKSQRQTPESRRIRIQVGHATDTIVLTWLSDLLQKIRLALGMNNRHSVKWLPAADEICLLPLDAKIASEFNSNSLAILKLRLQLQFVLAAILLATCNVKSGRLLRFELLPLQFCDLGGHLSSCVSSHPLCLDDCLLSPLCGFSAVI